MKLYSENEYYKLYEGNMLDMLDVIEPETIDSIVTDPPYELNFMNKGWDNAGVSFKKETWQKCYEVLKPGGYLLAFGGSRTFHRIACAIEDAGFEIRDTIMWLYGSGFPKSMSLSKGLEAKEKLGNAGTRNKRKIEQACDTEEYKSKQTNNGAMGEIIETTRKEYIPDTDLAKQWKGWGTCLKPSFEPIIVARKPFKGSLVDNVIEYGVGGINIDECRVGNEHFEIKNGAYDEFTNNAFGHIKRTPKEYNGRFPANTILTYDETDFDEVCGNMPETSSCESSSNYEKISQDNPTHLYTNIKSGHHFDDSGNACRYFYCAKASKKDRDEGLDEFEEKQLYYDDRRGNSFDIFVKRDENGKPLNPPRKNIHPTVKPTELMQYLVRLVTPNNGTVLDPFNGSGSTGKAVMFENVERNKNYKYIGIELTSQYLPIAKDRIEYALKQEKQLKLF